MKKIFYFLIVLLLLFSCFNFNESAIKASSTQEKGNSLSLTVSIDNKCKSLTETAGNEFYSLENGEYTVKNSNNEVVGIFVLDENGVGHLKDSDKTTLTGLADGTYSIEMSKSVDNKAFEYDNQIKYVTLTSHTPKPTTISVNTITALYGKNSNGQYFSNNQYKLWSTTYGTGIFECGIAEVDSPCSIVDYGSHTLNVSDATILDRTSITEAGYSAELIYKIMYYGRSGPAQWSGFSNYSTPFMSRNGSSWYSGGCSGKEALAAFVSHVALSRAWGKDKGKWSYQSDIAGFSQFWSYVNNAEKAPDDFIVYCWQHSKVHSNEQDMFFGYTLSDTDYDYQQVNMTLSVQYDPIGTILKKESTTDQPIANAQYTIKYYNKSLIDIASTVDLTPTKTWVFETDQQGFITFSDNHKVSGDDLYQYNGSNIMLPGTYVVSETLVPVGYLKSEDFMIKVTTDIGDSVRYYSYDGKKELCNPFINDYLLTEYKEAYLDLKKSSSNNLSSASLEGAIYNIYTDNACTLPAKINNSDELAILKVNQDGSTNKVALIPGKYYVKEVKSPLGYQLDQTIYEVDLEKEQSLTLEVKDDPILYKFKKIDVNGNIVENAIIELYHDQELLATFTTTNDPIDISSYLIQNETYCLHEKSAPKGYLTSEDVTFTVNGKVDEFTIITMTDEFQPEIITRAFFSDGRKINPASSNKITIYDEIHISKLIKSQSYTIKGYIFNTNNLNVSLDEYEESFIADSESTTLTADFDISTVEDNSYVVFEYLYDEKGNMISSHCDIEDDQQIVTCPKTTKIIVIKKDESNPDKLLSDCEVTIFNSDGSIATDANGKFAIKTTNKEGQVEFDLFIIEENYYVQETKAPKGYKLNPEKFEVKDSQITITINDSKIPDTGDICIQAFSFLSFVSAACIYCFEKKKRSIK